MKVYRVIPDTFLVDGRVEEIPPKATEGIFYKMGYTSLSNTVMHTTNTIYKDLNQKIGKYFYLFFEDAVRIGYTFLKNCHHHFLTTFLILEYDIPLEIILKHFGYGTYTSTKVLLETFIQKEDFGSKIITTKDLKHNEKKNTITKEFLISMRNILEFGYDYSEEDFDFYFNQLNILCFNEFKTFLHSEEKVEIFLKDYRFNFNNTIDREIIKSPYITNRVIRINPDYLYNEVGLPNLTKYFEIKGYKFNINKEQEELKKTIIKSKNDKEKVKSLLLQNIH